MRIIRWLPTLLLSYMAMLSSPRSRAKGPTCTPSEDESEDDPFEPLSDEMNQVRSAAYRIYVGAGVILVGSFLFIGTLFMEDSPFPRPDFDFESLSWAIGVIVVLVVAFTFERQQSLPSHLEPGLDHVQLALLIRRKQMIVALSYCALGLTTFVTAMTVVGWFYVGYEPLRTFLALFLLGVFGVSFCEYALSARADAGILEELEDRRDARLADTYDGLLCAVDPRIARRTAAGAALGLLVATGGWGIGAYTWVGVPAVVVVALVPTWTYWSGLQLDAKNELHRLRRRGPDKFRTQPWILRFRAAVTGALGGLLYPAVVIIVVSQAGNMPIWGVVCIALATVFCGVPMLLGSGRIFHGEKRKIAVRRKQVMARNAAKPEPVPRTSTPRAGR